ncbi:MAG TPA: GNAT family N-acetyltransferase [Pseudosphingobacterium sp.]|nr:GNAT family N-acetyltransferase [Pseudosphingobacterium sp.]
MTSEFTLRKATDEDKNRIWEILQQAIELRRRDGSDQWQDGYPNIEVVQHDINQGYGYVLLSESHILAYIAIIFDGEPIYNALKGRWLSDQDYVVIHRLAVAQDIKTKGTATILMKQVEALAVARQIYSIKVDTNYDNKGMLRIFEKLGYQYCGEVYFRSGARMAFEKLLN